MPTKAKSKSKSVVPWLARVGFAPILALLAGCDRGAASLPAQPSSKEPVAVEVVAVGTRPMERKVTALGSLRAMDRATVSIKTSGRLKMLPVDVGTPVEAGQVIAQVEPKDYELRVDQALALLGQARARLGLPIEGDDDTVDLEKTGTVREAVALFQEAKSNLERVRKLETDRISSAQELERAQAEFEVTRSRYLDALQEARERQAILAQRRAEYAIARQQLSDASLRAPFSGIVQERLANVGEFLSGGSPVVTLVRTDPLRLQADIPERDAGAVRVGQSVRVEVDGETNRYTGALARVSPALNEVTRMLRVEAEIANPGYLRPGAFARVEIIVDPCSPALAIPADAVVAFAGTEKAMVITTNQVQERRVRVGRREAGWVEVLTGVKAGEQVIRRPGSLQSGDPVRIAVDAPNAASPPGPGPGPAPKRSS
ncbi:MAG: efflux RND transporter periplasmic adaptor subunit [Verrucomicrobiales bacterium]|nr:efflux RND transporter periplasmic adaptor subunit [Verrucomicrobiales bacterium]